LDRQQTRILVADSDARVRRALRTLLGQEPGPVVIRESQDVASLAVELRDFQPDLILLDWELPGRPAAALLFASQNLLHRPKMIVLSRRPEERQIALAAGADAFVSKSDSPERLLAIYRRVVGELAPNVE
jgi:two-component system phosphate regulon response regulator PhoB